MLMTVEQLKIRKITDHSVGYAFARNIRDAGEFIKAAKLAFVYHIGVDDFILPCALRKLYKALVSDRKGRHIFVRHNIRIAERFYKRQVKRGRFNTFQRHLFRVTVLERRFAGIQVDHAAHKLSRFVL